MLIRFFDFFFSLLAIVILAPLMIPIVICLKLTGEHHVFYRQIRVGKNGKKFGLLKFATMLEDSMNLPGGGYTSENDPRILPFGKILRKTKINELPQLWNILVGDMSIIGYRPTVPKGYERWPEWAKKKLRKARPGLSGIGSIVFRNEEEILHKIDNKDEYYARVIIPYKMKLEVWYSKNKSIKLYWKLIALTVDAVLGGKRWKTLEGLPPIPNELRGVL